MKAHYAVITLLAVSVLLLLMSLAFFQNYTAMKGMVLEQQKSIDQLIQNNDQLIQMIRSGLTKTAPVY